MRCPKCHYLSFDPDPRCRNCGYDLDIEVESAEADEPGDLDLEIAPVAVPSAAATDLPLRSAEAAAKPVTLELVRAAPPGAGREPDSVQEEPALALVGVAAEPTPVSVVRRAPARSAAPTSELPLFVRTMGPQELGAFAGLIDVGTEQTDDADVATVAAAPERVTEQSDRLVIEPAARVPHTARPLSVRRPVGETARVLPPKRRPGPLDHDLLEDLQRIEREEAHRADRRPPAAVLASIPSDPATDLPQPRWDVPLDASAEGVPISHRVGAAALDGLLLGGVAAFLLWATLRVADVSPSALGVASLMPMGVFLAGVSLAYLLMFTAAGGQTVGKMLIGIRVVGDDPAGDDRVTLAQAASRAVLAPISVAMLGLGWLPALIGRGPTLHDRLAHTRVVRA